jgi:hypothetical protein
VVAWAVELANADDRGTFNMFLRTEIAGGQLPVEKDFKRLVELGEVGTAG